MSEPGVPPLPRAPSPSLMASSPKQAPLPKNIIVSSAQLRSPSPSPKTPPHHSWGSASNKNRGMFLFYNANYIKGEQSTLSEYYLVDEWY